MQDKDLQKIADKIEDVPHVKNVIWYGSVMDFSIPREALPDDIYNFFNNKDADSQLMAVLFDESMSSDGTMDAIQTINDLVGKQCFVSGMASVNNDIRKLAENESVIYVLIAVVLSLIVLSLTMDSVVVPFLFLISIGMAIIYNLGSNVFFGRFLILPRHWRRYCSSVLQWIIPFSCGTVIRSRRSGLTEIKPCHGTCDFQYNYFRGQQLHYNSCRIYRTVFYELYPWKRPWYRYGKGCCLWCYRMCNDSSVLILVCDKAIEKTRHKVILPDLSRIAGFITKHHVVFVIAFLVVLIPAIYGYTHTNVYYDLTGTLPETFSSKVGNDKLSEQYHMGATHMVLAKAVCLKKTV